jgi:hypothetical protein
MKKARRKTEGRKQEEKQKGWWTEMKPLDWCFLRLSGDLGDQTRPHVLSNHGGNKGQASSEGRDNSIEGQAQVLNEDEKVNKWYLQVKAKKRCGNYPARTGRMKHLTESREASLHK